MSGANSQPWEFIAVQKSSQKKAIVEIYESHREMTRKLELTRREDLRHPGAISEEPVAFGEAPVILVVCGDLRTQEVPVLSGRVFLENTRNFDCNLANITQNIMLAAASMGLGTQWVSIGLFIEGRLKTLLGLPDTLRITMLVPIGYPAYTPKPGYRREVKEILHNETYDMNKHRTDDQLREWIVQLRKRVTPTYRV